MVNYGKSKVPAAYPNHPKTAPARIFFLLPNFPTKQRGLCGPGERKLSLNLEIVGDDYLLKEGFH